MDTDGDPAVVRDGVESEVAVRLIGESNLGFQVSGKEAKPLQARAILIQEKAAGELSLDRYALEEGAEIGPVGQQKRSEVEQDLAVIAHGGDGERLGDG